MKLWSNLLGAVLRGSGRTGSLASLATTLAVMACGLIENRNALAPLNAISHITYGDEAFGEDAPSLKYTLAGVFLNHSAMISWAALYEKFFGRAAAEGNKTLIVLGAVMIAVVAYITDYHLVPTRLKPGIETRLSNSSLFVIYAVLAVALVVAGLSREKE